MDGESLLLAAILQFEIGVLIHIRIFGIAVAARWGMKPYEAPKHRRTKAL